VGLDGRDLIFSLIRCSICQRARERASIRDKETVRIEETHHRNSLFSDVPQELHEFRFVTDRSQSKEFMSCQRGDSPPNTNIESETKVKSCIPHTNISVFGVEDGADVFDSLLAQHRGTRL
jgi:hypothetical protein